MNKGRALFAMVFILGLVTAFVFYKPLPDGITEPMKCRMFMAVMRMIKHIVSVAHIFINRDEPFDLFLIKSTRHIHAFFAPVPMTQVQGSNIRSRVTEFDGVSVRLYEQINKTNSALPAVVYMHGGGMCIGTADVYDELTRKIAEDLGCVLVSVDYRLAPEHPFPAGFEDCLRATRYFIRHAHEFNVDQHRIAIGGDSAGGHLSASVAQAIHDDANVPDLRVQFLIYPSTQEIDLLTPSYQKYMHDFGEDGIFSLPPVSIMVSLTNFGMIDDYAVAHMKKNNHTSSKFKRTSSEYSYVNHEQLSLEYRDPKYYRLRTEPESGNDELWERMSVFLLDPRGAPLLRHDLSGLPPAYVITCGFDAIRDDAIFYKNRLEDAGVQVTWVHYEEAFHGVMSLTGGLLFNFSIGTTMLEEMISFLKTNV